MGLEENIEAIGLSIYPDTLVLGQLGYLRRRDRSSRERDMFAALLEDALRCWLERIGESRLHQEADRWIYGDYECKINFATVCELLDLDPQWIRRKLPELRQKSNVHHAYSGPQGKAQA